MVWSTLLITDLFLGLYSPALMAAVYIAACAPIVLRSFLRKKPTVWRAGGCARRIGPVLCLDQHRGLAAGHGLQPRRQWLAGVLERWRTVLAKCNCRRHSLFWRAVYRLGRCRTHHEFAPSVDPPQTHPSRRSSLPELVSNLLRPTVGHDAARERLPRLRANHSVAKKVGQELGRGEMVLRPLPKAKSSPGGPTT